MRGASAAALILFALWLVFVLRSAWGPSVQVQVSTWICDRQGREIRSIEPGFVTRYRCGARKPAGRDLKRP